MSEIKELCLNVKYNLPRLSFNTHSNISLSWNNLWKENILSFSSMLRKIETVSTFEHYGLKLLKYLIKNNSNTTLKFIFNFYYLCVLDIDWLSPKRTNNFGDGLIIKHYLNIGSKAWTCIRPMGSSLINVLRAGDQAANILKVRVLLGKNMFISNILWGNPRNLSSFLRFGTSPNTYLLFCPFISRLPIVVGILSNNLTIANQY